jgi:hypothetical protein
MQCVFTAFLSEIIDSTAILNGVLLVKRGIRVSENIVKKRFDRARIKFVGRATKKLRVLDEHPVMQISPEERICSFVQFILSFELLIYFFGHPLEWWVLVDLGRIG